MSQQNQPTPESDEAIARKAYAQGDLNTAIAHIACALSVDCIHPVRMSLLNNIIRASANPRSLILTPIDNPALIAVQAYILQHLDHTTQAFDLLQQAARKDPRMSYIAWVQTWLTQAEQARPDIQTILSYLAAHLDSQQAYTRKAFQQHADAGLSLCLTVEADFPKEATLHAFKSEYLLLLRRMEQALQAATEAYTLAANWQNAMSIGLVHKACGRVASAQQYFTIALQHAPDDFAAPLEMADMLLKHHQYQAALTWYERVLQRNAKETWALPSSLFCKAKVKGKNPWYECLSKYAYDHPEHQRANDLLLQLRGDCGVPYEDYLPEYQGPITDVLHRFYREQGATSMGLNLQTIEAPSGCIAIHHALEQLNSSAHWDINCKWVANERQDDPRLPWGEQSEWSLWRYDDVNPIPAWPEPSNKKVMKLIKDLAESDYRLATWWGRAMMIANLLNDNEAVELLCIILHPPFSDTFCAWVWIQRAQTAAIFVLANIGDNWLGSAKRRALLAILQGPVDWPVVSVITALTQLSQDCKGIAIDTQEQFSQLHARNPFEGYCFYAYPLVLHWLKLPHINSELTDHLHKQLKSLAAKERERAIQRQLILGSQQ